MPLSDTERRALVARKVRAIRIRRTTVGLAVVVPMLVAVAVLAQPSQEHARVITVDQPTTTTAPAVTATSGTTSTTEATTTTTIAANKPTVLPPTTTTTVPENMAHCGAVHQPSGRPPTEIEVVTEVSPTSAPSGANVRITVRARNTTDSPYRYSYSGPTSVISIADSEGRRVWTNNWGMGFTTGMTEDEFAPHEEKRTTVTWRSDQVCGPNGAYVTRSLRPGRYTVLASWGASPDWDAPSAVFDLR